MGERGSVRRDRVHAAQSSFLAFSLADTLQHVQYQKKSLEKARNTAKFVLLEPRLVAYTVLSHYFSFGGRVNRIDFVL